MGSFLDTTIIVHLSDPSSKDKLKSEACVSANPPSEAPYYSLRELLAGHIQNLCTAHKGLYAAENHGEALLNISRQLQFSGRKKGSILDVIFGLVQDAFSQNLDGSRIHMKTELLDALALRINTLWRNAQNLRNVDIVQPLSCFDDCKIGLTQSGELTISTNSFNCNKKLRCSAAEYIYDDKSSLKKMIAALHPNNLDKSAAIKTENASRRKALKDLETSGPIKFNKLGCRALGDAYFASMCPPGKVVITSNISDYLPLCKALGKEAIEP